MVGSLDAWVGSGRCPSTFISATPCTSPAYRSWTPPRLCANATTCNRRTFRRSGSPSTSGSLYATAPTWAVTPDAKLAAEYHAPDITELVAKTTIEHFEDKSNDCWELVKIEITDNEGTSHLYDSAIEGIPDYRLPMSELRTLANEALGLVLDPTTVTTVLDTLETLDTCPDVAALIPLLI